MGRKRWCFGRTDITCPDSKCPYLTACSVVLMKHEEGRTLTLHRLILENRVVKEAQKRLYKSPPGSR